MARAALQHPAFLLIEFLILCVLVPTLIIVNTWASLMFLFLWGASLYAFGIHKYTTQKTIKEIWKWDAVTWEALKPILFRWVLASVAMLIFLMWYDPERLFFLPRTRPEFLPTLMTMYPVMSALPQELIFCTFFFARYARYFGNGKWMVLASALTFAYAHILYINPVAPTLSFFGGMIFAMTYLKTKSLALVTIEHGLYGNSLFIIGLGWYFYSGSVTP